MLITVRGVKNEKIKRKEIIFAANFFGNLLMKRLHKKLNIDFKFVSLSDSVNGYCHVYDDDPRPKWFEIELRRGMDRDNIISTMAHEMVHIKQFARRELIDLDTRELPKYMGERFNTEKISYWDQPWEIEAFGREVGLVTRYRTCLSEDKKLYKRLTT